MDPARYLDANRRLWEAWTDVHEKSDFYDVEGFIRGRSRLKPIERDELLPLARGKTLLHLQCHFGLDTMSWAREGVKATGVDFSEKAIALARSVNEKAGLDARFVCSDIDGLPRNLQDRFDIVFTSYGVLCWLPDIRRWAEVIAHFLKPGGTFYIVEFHPFANMMDNEGHVKEWRVTEPYFHSETPQEYQSDGSYADLSADVHMPEYEWSHPISDVVSALLEVGLTLDFVHEFSHTTYQQFPFLVKHGPWDYRPPEGMRAVPLLYSIRARAGRQALSGGADPTRGR